MNIQIPKIFCISLKENFLRKLHIEYHLKSNQIDFEFFDGINGKQFGLKTNIPFKDKNCCLSESQIKQLGDKDYYITSGHIGCILSHYMLWKTLSHLPYEEIIIFEDDIQLCEDFKNKFFNFKSKLPDDWQYVFLGHYFLPEQFTQISDGIITSNPPPLTTHAYMIKKSSIPILLETNHLAWGHIDIQIQKRSLKYLKHYTFYPSLVNQLSVDLNENEFKSLNHDT